MMPPRGAIPGLFGLAKGEYLERAIPQGCAVRADGLCQFALSQSRLRLLPQRTADCQDSAVRRPVRSGNPGMDSYRSLVAARRSTGLHDGATPGYRTRSAVAGPAAGTSDTDRGADPGVPPGGHHPALLPGGTAPGGANFS